MAISKVIFNGETLMDTTQKTVTDSSMLYGVTALKNDGTNVTGNIASKSSSDLTVSGATVTAPAGFYSSNASKSVASGSASTPATTITANPSISVSSGGLITATASATKSVTPTVSAGYVSSGTAGTITVSGSNTSQLSTQAAATIHPSTSDQSIASGTYLTGVQTVKAVTLSNLTAGNIKSGVTIKIGDSTDDDCVTSVTGTYVGGSVTQDENGYIILPPTGGGGGGGGNSYTKIASQDLAVNTSSTSAVSVGTISLGSTAWTAAKILYIRIRDKAGARNDYFVGSDNYIFNYLAASGATIGTEQIVARQVYSKSASGAWGSSNSTYGVYVVSIAADGTLALSARYSSSSSRTIDGTYNITVYTLDYAPDQGNPFNYSF